MPSWKKVILSGSNAALNSLTVSNGITGSLFGTASFALTSSFLGSTTNAFIQNGNSFGATALLGTNDNQSLALETSGSTRMFISSSGNIGINTTASAVALQVGDTTSGAGNYIKVLGNNSDSTYDVFVGARRYPRLQLQDTTVGGSTFQMWSLGNTMRFGTDTGTQGNSAWFTKAGIAADVIFNGNVGIGIISPTAKLDISGSLNISGSGVQIPLQVSSGSTPLLFVSQSGKVGIGTSTFVGSIKLAVNGQIGGPTYSSTYLDVTGDAAQLRGNSGIGFYAASSDHIFYGASNAERVRITNAGNVGIGTTTPNYKLHVTGSGTSGSFNADGILIVSGSNVGIGTATPSASLQVQGNFQISTGSLYTYGQNTDIDSGSFRTVITVSTSSYRAAFFDYVLTSGSNARAGTVFSVWQGTSVEYADTSTNDIGNTTGVNLLVSMSGANIGLFASSSNDNWSMKALARMI